MNRAVKVKQCLNEDTSCTLALALALALANSANRDNIAYFDSLDEVHLI